MEKQFRLLIPALIAFVFCFLLTAFYNRYASDDFEFLFRLRETGFSGSINYFYHNWNTRWLAIGWMNLVFMMTSITGSLLFYHMLSLMLLWLAFYRLIINFITGWFTSFVISGFMTVSFFYSCFSISDVFFWVNTSTMYLYGIIAFIFAIGEVINERNKIAGWLILILSSFYLGGCYEPLVFTAMVASVVYLIFMFGRNGVSITFKPRVLKVIIMLSVLMIAFAISYAGEGHTVRSSFLPQTTIPFKVIVLLKSVIKMLFLILPQKILPALLFAFPWFLFGMWQQHNFVSVQLIKRAGIIFIGLIVVSLTPIAFIMSEMGPERSWTQISLYLTCYTSLLACYGGNVLRNKYQSDKVVRLYAVISFLYIPATGIPQLVLVKKYSHALDERIKILDEFKVAENDYKVVTLQPLPESGWLHSAEISTNPEYFTNQHLKKYLELNFDLVVSGEKSVK